MNLQHYLCSKCFSPDRDRLYALYFKNYLSAAGSKIHMLDIAPAGALRNFIKKQTNVLYRSMDLMMDNVDDRLDITDMHTYNNGQFDFFICSHVLEHIPDDVQAMRELYRVTKKGGQGIVMVPINLALEETLEDPSCNDTAYRWKYFFQDDHVRMYAKQDFVQRLCSARFTVNQLDQQFFTEAVFLKNAIHPTSVLYIVEK
jgi:SAM-dependent methyltransferase